MIDNKLLARNMIEDTFDSDSFIQRLFLFDNYIIESIRLKEIPHIINLIGYDGLLILLKSNILRIKCDVNQFGEVGRLRDRPDGNEKILDYEQYSFNIISSVESYYLTKCFKEIESRVGLSKKEFIKLKEAISDNLVRAPKELGQKTLNGCLEEINRSEHLISLLIKNIINEDLNIKIKESDIKLNIEIISNNDILVESNLHTEFKEKFDLSKSHEIVSKALLSLVSTNLKFEVMETFNTKTLLNDKDTVCIDKKLQFLIKDANINEKNFSRVLEIKNYPKLNLRPDIKVNIDKLIEIRESKNCIEFRNWINTVDKLTNDEINDYLKSYRDTIKNFLIHPGGKTLRFLATTSVGILNPIAGVTLSAIDTFLIDKFLGTNGSKIFLSEDYARIFDLV
ncbi:hypothetical protein [Aliarcobacter butzleri]|uniref:hypothetical protein n=1 Tax=Aliarcobacter butzleri TaxID=28197 RepID=UPI003AF93EB1